MDDATLLSCCSISPLTSCRVAEKRKSAPAGSGRGLSQATGWRDSLGR